jgi:hypothetical protein
MTNLEITRRKNAQYVVTDATARFLRTSIAAPIQANSPSFSSFRRVLIVVCFFLGNSSASEFYMPIFRNTPSHLHRRIGIPIRLWRWNRQCSETSAHKIQTSVNYPEEGKQQSLSFFYSSSHIIHTQNNIREYAQTIPIAVLKILFEHLALNFLIYHLRY